jgi:acetylornithine/succinyldiaminopimelate/putrescine aminotransferase
LRILPALTITEDEIAQGIARLDTAASAVSKKIATA